MHIRSKSNPCLINCKKIPQTKLAKKGHPHIYCFISRISSNMSSDKPFLVQFEGTWPKWRLLWYKRKQIHHRNDIGTLCMLNNYMGLTYGVSNFPKTTTFWILLSRHYAHKRKEKPYVNKILQWTNTEFFRKRNTYQETSSPWRKDNLPTNTPSNAGTYSFHCEQMMQHTDSGQCDKMSSEKFIETLKGNHFLSTSWYSMLS